MYKSKEIRWFKDHPDKDIIEWFAQKGQTFENTKSRTDYYMPLDKNDIAIKLREGKIEIKQRMGEPREGNLSPDAVGIFENYIKWSFVACQLDELSQQIMTKNPYNWIEAVKIRIGVKVTEDTSGKRQIVSIKDYVDFGCQIEYTSLELKAKTIYTFSLEWFGDKEPELPPSLIQEIIGSATMKIQDSMGYAENLRRI